MEVPKLEKALLQNLLDAGCDEPFIKEYCALEMAKAKEPCAHMAQIRLLTHQRQRLLNNLHDCQFRLDCMDYLLFQLRQSGKKGKK